VGPITNRYTRLIGIEHPIVQEGLGPFRTPKLAAAVSQAGGLGTVSMPGMPADLAAGARTLRIVLPDGKDAELEELMTKWRNEKPYDPRSGIG